ncbi:flagellar hook-associated protein 1 [Deltaproteobacteria bacterium]|nr:flagellar hook-associated protein 1 [Deltaproteobacteria bacterium]
MSLLGALNTGARGLGVASAGIDVTAQNVTGANTPGFSRRTLRTTQLDPVASKGLWIGQGAMASSVVRSTDRLLGVRLIDAAGAEASTSTLSDTLSVAESYFDGSTATGLSEAIDKLFDALGTASADPSDASQRRSVVYAAEVFSGTANRVATGLSQSLTNIEESLGANLDEVNAALEEIAALNARIGHAGADVGPADLLDRRDQLILDLATRVGATAQLHADGQAEVYVAGHAVVSGGDWREMSTGTNAAGESTITVAMDDGDFDITKGVGGAVGGLTEARERISGWADDLDALAFTFATAMNTQHAAGFDQSGAAGTDLFTLPTSAAGAAAAIAVTAAISDDPSLLALAGSASALAGDGENLAAMLDIENDDSLFSTGTIGAASSAITASVGSAVAAAESDAETQSAIVGDLETLRESVSGVDTDEEATHMLEYQSAYRAAAKVISACDELLRTLLQIGG